MKIFQSRKHLYSILSTVAIISSMFVTGKNALYAQDQPDKVVVSIDGNVVQPSFGTIAGSWFYNNGDKGSQLLLLGFPKGGVAQLPNYKVVSELVTGSTISLDIPLPADAQKVSCTLRVLGDSPVDVVWANSDSNTKPLGIATASTKEKVFEVNLLGSTSRVCLSINAPLNAAKANGVNAVEISNFQVEISSSMSPLSLEPKRKPQSLDPIETSPDFLPILEQALVEWDWKMQDGIGTEREPRTYEQALSVRIPQGNALLDDLQKTIDDLSYENLAPYDEEIIEKFESFVPKLEVFRAEWKKLEDEYASSRYQSGKEADAHMETIWRQVHTLRRSILLSSPYFQVNSILFFKYAPGVLSHQLEQLYGYTARPGGGIFILEEPGKTMKTKEITPKNLPLGSYMTPELSFDAKDLYFAFCETPDTPKRWCDSSIWSRRFHLYKISLDNSETAQQLTDGDFDDFSPLQMPDNDLVFSSTRRGGFHRCGGGPCYVYALARCGADGSNPHPISFHETHEWFPTLAHNGRIVYTRWDYVDRSATYFQQLWSTRQDGTDVRILYGNNTYIPPGMWEPKAIPGSDKIMALGGPHHAFTAGSVVLIDSTKGVDGPEPVERITPEVLYPEGEAGLPKTPYLPTFTDFDYRNNDCWLATRPGEKMEPSAEQRRWPGHCFKAPYPLAERYFIASYSFDQLVGECGPNIPNQFGIYFCDAFGTRELIYRDPNISSVWARPARPRPVPPLMASTLDEERCDSENPTGTFFVQNIYESWPFELKDKIKSLRIVQVVLKTTPNANQPMVGTAFASPGKQILGVVPVEEDGSAFFEAPAKKPLIFQALDEKGRMILGMRSLVYLQPGESAGCVGCHENRMETTPNVKTIASTKQPAKIQPAPDGAKPFSYPILVQPVLDKNCVECHCPEKAEGGIDLTGAIDGHYTKSYNVLVNYVPTSYWTAPEGNYEPRTEPNRFGSRASKLTKILDADHYGVKLTDEEWERLNIWQDTNALFYGTFNPDEQAIQQKGGRIPEPSVE